MVHFRLLPVTVFALFVVLGFKISRFDFDRVAYAESAGGSGGNDKVLENSKVAKSPGATVDRRYTSVEIELLQNLAERRNELSQVLE